MIENTPRRATDPSAGWTVEPEVARAAGLAAEHRGQNSYFCGNRCLLEFRDDPDKYLGPNYSPSM